MTTQLENQLRDVLSDAPEPDWHALRAAVEARAGRQRRGRMLRATVGGAAAAAAVVAIAVGAANSPIFEGQRATPAKSTGPTPSASPSVPASTAFVPRVKLPNGDYRMPMALPDVAPKGEDAPEGLERAAESSGIPVSPMVASRGCLTTAEAAKPQPWGSDTWSYRPPVQSQAPSKSEAPPPPSAEVTIAGWPTTTAVTAMRNLADNSGACTYDRPFRKVAWTGLAGTEANQFVVDAPSTPGGKRFVAIRRVGDVTVDAWTSGTDEARALAESRRLVDESVVALLASKVLVDPQTAVWSWPDGVSEAFPDGAHFILPAIDPAASVTGIAKLVRQMGVGNSAMGTVPVLGAQVGDQGVPGMRPVAVRTADYVLTGASREDEGEAWTSVVWSSFPDGKGAFDEIVADRGTARWSPKPVREQWAGHDSATSYLATQSRQLRPQQIALRLEGDVLISVVAQGETQAQARTIATKLADEAAKNLASYGRGPDGRPGNGR